MDARHSIEAWNQQRVTIGTSPHGYGYAHFARRNFRPGEVVMQGYGRRLDHQTPHCSIQVGPHEHVLPTKWTGRYWNHSCDPNTYCRTRNGYPELVAQKHIKQGEEITYAYYTSEYTWHQHADEQHLRCRCGARNCAGKIFSFSQITPTKQRELRRRGRIAEHLRSPSKALMQPHFRRQARRN